MARRWTISGRAELGFQLDPATLQGPPPDYPFSKPRLARSFPRWHLHPPRLRGLLKLGLWTVIAVLLFGLYCENDALGLLFLPPADDSKDWLWKDFPRHGGLVRGTRELRSDCRLGQPKCVESEPQMRPYDGLKNFEEPVSDIRACIGPRGNLINESSADFVWAYDGVALGAADPVLGSYHAAGIDGSVSFDRIGRYQAYRSNEDEQPYHVQQQQEGADDVNWDQVDWRKLQDTCVETNKHRFKPIQERPPDAIQYPNTPNKNGQGDILTEIDTTSSEQLQKTKRTAILVRAWTGVPWSADVVINLRAMIAEASLASGGKYQVFVLLHVRDEAVPLYVGEEEPMNTIRQNVPPEFQSITEVWNHAQTRALYSNMPEHAFVARAPWMIIQWFARNHPEFDFFYQWEFDVRFTGHYLDFLESVSRFAKEQPRKGIWERASRFYIPAVHGKFDTFFRWQSYVQEPDHVWGPVMVDGVKSQGPSPPRSEVSDEYEWGVGEDADWLGFLPSFNVTGTNWFFKDYLWGYPEGLQTPRRATLVTHGRVSRRLLQIMNDENAHYGHLLDAEMFPQTMCLHHGLKATTVPHPIFADREWPTAALQKVFNPGPGGQAGGVAESTFSKWNEDVWINTTWYYNSEHAKSVYQQFLGLETPHTGVSDWEERHGRAIVRPMLLHPIKSATTKHWTHEGWVDLHDQR